MPIFGIKWASYQDAKKSPGKMGTLCMLWHMKDLGGRDMSIHESGYPMYIEFWELETALAALQLISEEYTVSLCGTGWSEVPAEQLVEYMH